MPHAAVATAVALATRAAAIDFPDINIKLPHISGGDKVQFVDDAAKTESASCSPQNLARYPSGWPTALDWGIYWFGPGGQFKRASKRQQVHKFDPRTWFDNGDGYPNSTQRWKSEFYDPSRSTVIYFHGWSGTGAWSTQECKRVTTICGRDLCADSPGLDLADSWLKEGWNVGYFYWDQFADEPCMRDAEQKIWFDRKGDGLKWASFSPADRVVSWKEYMGPELSVADLCVTAVKEAIGDFYAGSTVRFVGRSIGSQLAVSCAAKLHEDKHVAAPQRMALLDPFFTQKEFSFLGAGIRCGKVTSETGIGGFAQEATANYVKMLWKTHRVSTEIYVSTRDGDDDDSSDMDSTATQDMQSYAVQVAYKPRWCRRVDGDSMQCEHRSVYPLYFLGLGIPPPPTAANLNAPTGLCQVPSASCSDQQLRVLVEQHVTQAERRTEARLPLVNQVWGQAGGAETFTVIDDMYSPLNMQAPPSYQPSEEIERQVFESDVMSQRAWGLDRRWHLGQEAGMSRAQLDLALKVLGLLVMIPIAAFAGYLIAKRVQRCVRKADSDDDDDDASDVMSPCPSDTSGMGKMPLMHE